MKSFAVIACLLAVILGAVATFLHALPVYEVVMRVTWVWLLANIVISGSYTKKYWQNLDLGASMSQLYRSAKEGKMPEVTAVEQVSNLGLWIFLGLSVYLSFV